MKHTKITMNSPSLYQDVGMLFLSCRGKLVIFGGIMEQPTSEIDIPERLIFTCGLSSVPGLEL